MIKEIVTWMCFRNITKHVTFETVVIHVLLEIIWLVSRDLCNGNSCLESIHIFVDFGSNSCQTQNNGLFNCSLFRLSLVQMSNTAAKTETKNKTDWSDEKLFSLKETFFFFLLDREQFYKSDSKCWPQGLLLFGFSQWVHGNASVPKRIQGF